MAYYLIDFENEKNICGICDLTKQDTLIFFYTKNANVLSFDLHQDLMHTSAAVEYREVGCGGKNALDFQLSSYAGYLLAMHPNQKIVILSNDKGFEYVVDFWKQHAGQAVDLTLEKTLFPQTHENRKDKAILKTEKGEPLTEIVKVLKQANLSLSDSQIDQTITIVRKAKSKQDVNTRLMCFYKNSTLVGKIIKLLKPFIPD